LTTHRNCFSVILLDCAEIQILRSYGAQRMPQQGTESYTDRPRGTPKNNV